MSTIATWNVNSLKVRLEHLGQWLQGRKVDAIALQELKVPDEQFPMDEVRALGLQAAHYGQKTYNGVAILGPASPAQVVTGMPEDDPQRRVIAATVGGIRLVNVYVPNAPLSPLSSSEDSSSSASASCSTGPCWKSPASPVCWRSCAIAW